MGRKPLLIMKIAHYEFGAAELAAVPPGYLRELNGAATGLLRAAGYPEKLELVDQGGIAEALVPGSTATLPEGEQPAVSARETSEGYAVMTYLPFALNGALLAARTSLLLARPRHPATLIGASLGYWTKSEDAVRHAVTPNTAVLRTTQALQYLTLHLPDFMGWQLTMPVEAAGA